MKQSGTDPLLYELLPDGKDKIRAKNTISGSEIINSKNNNANSPANHDTTPANHDTTPANRDTTPANYDTMPDSHDMTPAIQDTTPANHDITPANRDTTPANYDTMPDSRDTTPANHDTTKSGNGIPQNKIPVQGRLPVNFDMVYPAIFHKNVKHYCASCISQAGRGSLPLRCSLPTG